MLSYRFSVGLGAVATHVGSQAAGIDSGKMWALLVWQTHPERYICVYNFGWQAVILFELHAALSADGEFPDRTSS